MPCFYTDCTQCRLSREWDNRSFLEMSSTNDGELGSHLSIIKPLKTLNNAANSKDKS